jgi:hypothetical protein
LSNDGTLFQGTIQEHLHENGSAKIYFQNQELGNLNGSGQKGLCCTRKLLWDFGIGKVNNQWRFRNKLAGFDYSARYFEITDAFEVYKHEYKGVLGCSWIIIT